MKFLLPVLFAWVLACTPDSTKKTEPTGCNPACGDGMHCEGAACTTNVCIPLCAQDYYCQTHGGTECVCTNPPCDPSAACSDGLDNDADGWIDAADPDCTGGDAEVGLGLSTCNDGLDNDSDGDTDAADADCTTALVEEMVVVEPCLDVCTAGATADGQVCRLWDEITGTWATNIDDGPGRLHNRARNYTAWLRLKLMPAGGVMRGIFSDETFSQVNLWAGTRDSTIWTGTYLAAESLRYLVTGAPDALDQITATLQVLHRWWRISGDRGYLARYAAPAASPADVTAIFAAADPENHRDYWFENAAWNWKGNISRDQYQGVMLGYAWAYEAVTDEALRELIRADVVDFVEQLMDFRTRSVRLVIDGIPMTVNMQLGYSVLTDDEMPNGVPQLDITSSPFGFTTGGFLQFWPRPAQFLRQVPALSWVPDITFDSQAIQLGSMFSVALRVTDGIPAYATRRQAILEHYLSVVDDWLDLSADWSDTSTCGDSYHGKNIVFQPAWNWARLESDPVRSVRLQSAVLTDALWNTVSSHKNVFFAFITASVVPGLPTAVVTDHLTQLNLFPSAPNTAHAVDNTVEYPANPSCDGKALLAIDVDDRVPSTFMWERNPWELIGLPEPTMLYSGVDFLVVYW
ncbi:hypothetical protein KKC22_13565, partial [Myxococcota bacterium]|nr:hypothetical protein [Myxococcota bacterium]